MDAYSPYPRPQNGAGYQMQYFPQPQGNVYMINNSMEVANVPMGAGISVAICPSESLLYLKSMQNGTPSFMAYSIAPYQPQANTASTDVQNALIAELKSLRQEVDNLKKSGGKFTDVV
jgi:hypothetical protein